MQLKTIFVLCLVVLVPVFHSCKPAPPEGVLSESKMKEVLRDYHMAQGMAQQSTPDSINFYTRLYQQAVYKKYGIDAEQFDYSMKWYLRNTIKLKRIYDQLAEQMGDVGELRNEVRLLGPGQQSASGDSLNLWHGPNMVLLNSQGKHILQHSERVDTALHKGDCLIWKFRHVRCYKDAILKARAVLALYYEGDSVDVYQTNLFAGSDQQSLRLDVGQGKVTHIETIVYQDTPWSDKPRLLNLFDFQLLRIRQHNQSVENGGMTLIPSKEMAAKQDSIRPDTTFTPQKK